jgi:hypothetical protein
VVAYLEKYGPLALVNGYEIIPIKPGTKRPPFDNWEDIRATNKKLARWIENGRGEHGVGILTRKTPLVDIDCRDRDIVAKMVEFTEELCGETLQRVGLAPKTGLVYRTSEPFRKVNSKTYVDPDNPGISHKVEILGDGQQFVAFAVHPDTGKPYRWLDKHSPHDTEWDSLPEITRDQGLEIVAEFERLAEEAGWIEKRTLKRLEDRRSKRDEIDDDDRDFSDDHPIDITTQELSLKLGLVPGSDDYDTWLQVGMALWHQYRGSDEGLVLWHEWSAQASNYDEDALDDKWPTFEPEKGREPVTARLIVKLANEEEKRLAGEQVQDTREEIAKARTVEALIEVARSVKRLAFEPVVRDGITNLVRKRHKEITGDTMSAVTARQLTRYENPENKRAPKWLDGFVYVEKDKIFYHVENRMELDAEAFNARHNRFMMTQKDRLEGRSAPEHTAVQASLNLWEIETVYRRMYMPHEDQFFVYNGQRFVNFYTEVGIPDMPEKLNSDEKAAIARVKAHLRHLFPVERDWKLLLDWLAHIVQTRRRSSWMPLMQGTEGDGKTFFAHLLKHVLGWENVAIVPGEALEEKYNHFMEGALLVFFEEVRLHGADRYSALNRMKPWITNQTINIRRMLRGSYEIVNTASLLAASNHKDAIPAGANSTRYFPIFSRWQTRTALKKFNERNPEYYKELYATLEHAGALRKWLMDWEISEEFDPDARAPESSSRAEMVALNESDEETAFDEALAESTRLDFCDTMLDSALVSDLLMDKGAEAPYGRALKRFLSERGFSAFPKKVKVAGKTLGLWSRTPEQFRLPDGTQDNDKIRKWLESNDL